MAIKDNCLNYIMNMIDMNVYIKTISFHRDTDESFLNGVLTEKTYSYGKSRAMVSLKVYFLRWLHELITGVITAVSQTVVFLGIFRLGFCSILLRHYRNVFGNPIFPHDE